MSTTQSLMEGVGILFAIILLAMALKRTKVIQKDHSLLFSRIVLYVTLPALIFSSLSQRTFSSEYLKMAGIMATIELLILFIAWLLATLLKLKNGKKGALILVSAFGMTTMLGYPLIRQVFPDNALAMEEAVITSEFGVGLLLFIFGPLIAMYYGKTKVEGKFILQSVRKFFISPIFISLIAGILFSTIPSETKSSLYAFFHFFQLIGQANLLMVTFTIGLILEFKKLPHIYLFLGIAIFLKLVLKPLLAIYFTQSSDFTDMMREIVMIETALPSAILTAVFAKQYDCRPDLVSMAIILSLIFSLISVPFMFYVFF